MTVTRPGGGKSGVEALQVIPGVRPPNRPTGVAMTQFEEATGQ